MNLNTTDRTVLIQELQELLSTHDDNAGDHIIWVDTRGDVHINPIPEPPEGDYVDKWARSLPDYKFRKERTERGKGWMGPGVASDLNYVKGLLEKLLRDWANDVRVYSDI